MIILPVLAGVADQRYKIPLDGRQYVIRLTFSARLESWYLSLSDADDVAIHTRIRIVTGYRLLQSDVTARRPPGDFYCFDSDVDPPGDSLIGLDELGSRFPLFYLTADEIAALSAAPPLAFAVAVTP